MIRFSAIILSLAMCSAASVAAPSPNKDLPGYHFRNRGMTAVFREDTKTIDIPAGATIPLGKPATLTCTHPKGCMLTVQGKAGVVDSSNAELCAQIDGVPDPLFCDGGPQGRTPSLLETARIDTGQHTVQLTATDPNGDSSSHISYWEVIYTLYDKGD